MKAILVTGINGFVGRHLAKELHSQGYSIIGTGMDEQLADELSEIVVEFIGPCDLTKRHDIARLPFEKIDKVINLAGLAQIGYSFSQNERYQHINVQVHKTLVEFLHKSGELKTRIVAVSSGAVYDSKQSMPLHEESATIKEGSPYALSKLAMENSLRPFVEQGMDIIIARPFNHIGPGQSPGFILPDLANQVMTQSTVSTGNLSSKRDYTDVRDVVKAYSLLATSEDIKHAVYNICSGTSVSGESILRALIEESGKSDISIEFDDSRIRPNDPSEIVGDYSRLQSDTGWSPRIPIQQTIHDYMQSNL